VLNFKISGAFTKLVHLIYSKRSQFDSSMPMERMSRKERTLKAQKGEKEFVILKS